MLRAHEAVVVPVAVAKPFKAALAVVVVVAAVVVEASAAELVVCRKREGATRVESKRKE